MRPALLDVLAYPICYTDIGDGDSSSFNKVVQSKPYGETFMINKLECVGHIQKRLGYRLCTLRQT